MNPGNSPSDWPKKWAPYMNRNERARYEYDRKTGPSGSFNRAVCWSTGALNMVYRAAENEAAA